MTFALTPPPGELPNAVEPGSFEEWCAKLDKEARRRGYTGGSLTYQCGTDFWRYYFDQEFSPDEALDDEGNA